MVFFSPAKGSSKVSRLQRTSAEIKGVVVGASITCFCIDPAFNRVYFLLGKERHNYRWPAGSGKWSDFGGGVTGEETGAEETAAREFVEETLGVVKFSEGDTLPITSSSDITKQLKEGKYMFKITQGTKLRKFVLYVKQIPWDPQCIYRFSDMRARLTRPCRADETPVVHPAISGRSSVKKEYLEKKILALFSIPQLRYASSHDGLILFHSGYIEHCRKSFRESLDLVLSEFGFQAPWMINE
jgi:hypothetical protein